MSKEYRYRTFIRWGQYVIPVFCGILLLLTLGLVGSLFRRIGSNPDVFLLAVISVEILFLLFGGALLLRDLFKPARLAT